VWPLFYSRVLAGGGVCCPRDARRTQCSMGRPKTIAIAVVAILVGLSILHQWRQFHQVQYSALQQQQLLWPQQSRDHDAGAGAAAAAVAPKNDKSSSLFWSVVTTGTSNTNSSTTTTPSTSTASSNTSSTSLLLLPWEIQSAMPTRLCVPPPGIPNYCCLGSISSGGAVRFNPLTCRLNVSEYDISSYTEQFMPSKVDDNDDDDKPRNCDVCDIVELVRSNNSTLSFLGDSMTRQTFVGLECEIRKRLYDNDPNINVVVTITTVKADRSNITSRLANDQMAWRYGLTETVTMYVTTTTTTNNTTNASSNTIAIHFYGMYRPFDDMEEVIHIFNTSDIVVFDFGLHFAPASDLPKFQLVMQRVVDVAAHTRQTSTRPHSQLLVWRETSAQHFDSPGGHYVPGIDSSQCVPMTSSSSSSHWAGVRLPILQQITRVQNVATWNSTDSILFIPYREFTNGLYHLHNADHIAVDKKQDCSHYCHTPYVWMPIWWHLKRGMEKFVALRQLQQTMVASPS
jgi:hypothetical protein